MKPTMKKSVLLIAGVLASSASLADDNFVYIQQVGSGDNQTTYQNTYSFYGNTFGSGNTSATSQDGNGNTTNTSTTTQNGNANVANTIQGSTYDGTWNPGGPTGGPGNYYNAQTALGFYSGVDGNNSGITQYGFNNVALAQQTGSYNTSTVTQGDQFLWNFYGIGSTNNNANVNQFGSYNTQTTSQYGDSQYASTTQGGSSNTATTYQYGYQPDSANQAYTT